MREKLQTSCGPILCYVKALQMCFREARYHPITQHRHSCEPHGNEFNCFVPRVCPWSWSSLVLAGCYSATVDGTHFTELYVLVVDRRLAASILGRTLRRPS